MRKLFFTLLLSAFSWALMAQSPINVGIHGGISNTKIKVKDIGHVLKSGSNTGYMVGVFARVNLGPIYLEPALNYSLKVQLFRHSGNGGTACIGPSGGKTPCLPRSRSFFQRQTEMGQRQLRYQYRQ